VPTWKECIWMAMVKEKSGGGAGRVCLFAPPTWFIDGLEMVLVALIATV
jgi:hypothetical protein